MSLLVLIIRPIIEVSCSFWVDVWPIVLELNLVNIPALRAASLSWQQALTGLLLLALLRVRQLLEPTHHHLIVLLPLLFLLLIELLEVGLV